MRKKPFIAVSILMLLAAGVIGWLSRDARLFLPTTAIPASSIQIRVNSPHYKFINPLLYSENAKDTSPQSRALSAALASFIATSEKSGAADSASVYFRYVNTGRWTGVNEDDLYRPSSMLKTVVLMAVLEIAQENPSFLSSRLPYAVSDHSDQYFKPNDGMASGSYTIQQLVNAMIVYSDNDALDALTSNAQVQREFTALYGIFRLPSDASSTPDFMSPKSFAAVFRTLYNSTVFPWSLSEQILDLLSRTTFTQGIVAGVPQGTVVAHKFGENTALSSDGAVGTRELHDCGIVYYPGDPYLLCIMTKGSDFAKLEGVIAGMSRIAYGSVAGQGAK